MRILAYLYSDPLLEPTPDPLLWGWEIDRVYQDQAIGQAAKGGKRDRPQWQQCIQDCQSEPADYLLVRRLEELGESVPEVSDRLAQLEALEIQLLAIEQSVSLTIAETAASSVLAANSIQADLLRLLQHLQREQRSRRIRQGHARNRIKAAPPPGKAPYGYRRSPHRYVIDRTTAPVVKEFFDQFLLYGSVRGAVRHLAKSTTKRSRFRPGIAG